MSTLTNPDIGLLIGSTWTKAADPAGHKAYARDPITIRYGRANWGGSTDPGSAQFTLDSRDHAWAPDDVSSAFWRSYARNIPCRIGVPHGTTFLESGGRPKGGGSGAFCNSSVSLQQTGAIDVRIEFQLYADPWDTNAVVGDNVPFAQVNLCEKWSGGGGGGWRMGLENRSGRIGILWQWLDAGGFPHSLNSLDFGLALPYWVRYRRVTLRVLFEPNFLSLGTTARATYFYGTGGVTGSFTSNGSGVQGVSTLGADTALVRISGNADSFNWRPFPGRTFAFRFLTGAGTVLASPTFEGAPVGASSVTDGQGNVFSMGSAGRITNVRWRFHGELASLPIRTNLRGNDIWAPVQASGILRRLRQGQPTLASPINRYVLRRGQSLLAYWPLEETGPNLTSFGPAFDGGQSVQYNATNMELIAGDAPKTGQNHDFICSGGLPVLGNGQLQGVPAFADPSITITQIQVRWLISIPSAPAVAGPFNCMDVGSQGTHAFYILWQSTVGGQFKLLANRASDNVTEYDSGWITFDTNGKPLLMEFRAEQNGADIDLTLNGTDQSGAVGGFTATSAVTGTIRACNVIRLNSSQGMTDAAWGHVVVHSSSTNSNETIEMLSANDRERAAVRIQRLCAEESIECRIIGDPFASHQMGPQVQDTLVNLLQQCADVDMGILAEARDTNGVLYRCQSDMTGQSPVLTLNVTAGETIGPPDLDRDDQGFVNDWSAKSKAGTSTRVELNDGSRISVSEPPYGAGRYASSIDLGCRDIDVAHMAQSRLRFTAVDEPRVTDVVTDMVRPAMISNSTLRVAVADSKIGDLIQVTNAPNVTAAVKQVVQGTTERIEPYSHTIGFYTSPGSPWGTGIVEDATFPARCDTSGSTLAASAIAGATSLSVASSTSILWTTSGGDVPFDIDVDGVRVHVTAISGGSSPQTFTVTAIPRALASGARVQLADPTYAELGW